MPTKAQTKTKKRVRTITPSHNRLAVLRRLKGSLKRHSKKKLASELRKMRKEWD